MGIGGAASVIDSGAQFIFIFLSGVATIWMLVDVPMYTEL